MLDKFLNSRYIDYAIMLTAIISILPIVYAIWLNGL
jgi:hypothetical protein